MLYWLQAAPYHAPIQENPTVASMGPDRAHSDTNALADLFEEHYDRLARYIAARVGNRDLAEDMAGEVFLRAVESLGSIEQRGVPLQAWLYRVARNLVIDHYRRNSRQQSVALDEVAALAGTADPAADVEHQMTMERVYDAMQRLNPAQQEVITLRFIGGLSSEEVGTVIGRTNGAVRELQRTALKALRGLIGVLPAEAGRVAPEWAGQATQGEDDA